MIHDVDFEPTLTSEEGLELMISGSVFKKYFFDIEGNIIGSRLISAQEAGVPEESLEERVDMIRQIYLIAKGGGVDGRPSDN